MLILGRQSCATTPAECTEFLTRIIEEDAKYILTDTLTVYSVRNGGNITNDRPASNHYTKRAILRAIKRRNDDPLRASATLPTMDSFVFLPIAS